MVEQQEWDEPEGRRAEATKRVYRALKIASLITSQPRQWSRSDLAGKLGVGDRTVDRDLEVLRALGYEIVRTGEGYVFTHVPAMAPLILSLPEVLAVTLAATLARDAGDIDTASLGSALAQLEGLVPLPARPLVRQELLRHAQDGASSAHIGDNPARLGGEATPAYHLRHGEQGRRDQ